VIPGAGAINRSMAGAGVAAPLDAAGSQFWNPASITALESSEFVVDLELLSVKTDLGSSFGGPHVETSSDSGVSGLPTVAITFRRGDHPLTFGLGLFSLGGFGQNYPGSTTNPILSPAGVGPVYSRLAILQLAPSAALQLTERLSIGFAPTVVMAEASLDPNAFDTPTAPLAYPPATHSRTHWGGGFHAGIYYETDYQWRFGASYKSPQWIEDFSFQTAPANQFSLSADFPAVASLGAAYYGLPRTVWAIDFRYVDYDSTNLFGDPTGYDAPAPTASWTGLGWRSVFSVSTGVQYELTDCLTVRLGYFYTENPLRPADTFFNIASSAIYQHIISMGATLDLTDRVGLSLAYLHAFENVSQGPWALPPGFPAPPPGSSVSVRQSIDALVAGLRVRF
jgi:long-chain fatty acid transport protein